MPSDSRRRGRRWLDEQVTTAASSTVQWARVAAAAKDRAALTNANGIRERAERECRHHIVGVREASLRTDRVAPGSESTLAGMGADC